MTNTSGRAGARPLPGRLRTARLILRPQTATDATVFHTLWTERDERVPAHRKLDAAGHPTASDIAAHITDPASERSSLLTVEDAVSGEVYGYCGLVFDANGNDEEPEVAFELLQAVHNRGYATEAATAVLRWAAEAGYRRAWAGVWEWNVSSRRVLDKLGFVDSGRSGRVSEHGRTLITVRDLGTEHTPVERTELVEHQDLSTSQLSALGKLFDSEYRVTHGAWNPDRPYGYSPAHVHVMLSIGRIVIAHVGFQRRTISAGGHEIVVAGTGGVLVHSDWRGSGVGRRVMARAQQAMRDDALVDFGYLGCREAVVPFYESTGWRRIRALERHISIADGSDATEPFGAPILIYDASDSRWPPGDVDLRGTPW
ncbi:GNAT family N-acetyltransferase [Microbacterium sp.]|uniref:GNAT family N-acetyltransferase n=1 Tax=Microbacterium sp. TaxID=51671 RepID=UPI00356145CB